MLRMRERLLIMRLGMMGIRLTMGIEITLPTRLLALAMIVVELVALALVDVAGPFAEDSRRFCAKCDVCDYLPQACVDAAYHDICVHHVTMHQGQGALGFRIGLATPTVQLGHACAQTAIPITE